MLRRERYSIGDEGQLKSLRYSINETEYRYKFKKVGVNVTSEDETAFRSPNGEAKDQASRQEGNGNNYEIHFWIIIKERPEKLLSL
jgi:hypothetical protein